MGMAREWHWGEPTQQGHHQSLNDSTECLEEILLKIGQIASSELFSRIIILFGIYCFAG